MCWARTRDPYRGGGGFWISIGYMSLSVYTSIDALGMRYYHLDVCNTNVLSVLTQCMHLSEGQLFTMTTCMQTLNGCSPDQCYNYFILMYVHYIFHLLINSYGCWSCSDDICNWSSIREGWFGLAENSFDKLAWIKEKVSCSVFWYRSWTDSCNTDKFKHCNDRGKT